MSNDELKQHLDEVWSDTFQLLNLVALQFDNCSHELSQGAAKLQDSLTLQVYEAFLAGKIHVPGKDLCDMSGKQKGRTPEQFTLYNVMLPRIYYPALQGNLYEHRCKVQDGPSLVVKLDHHD